MIGKHGFSRQTDTDNIDKVIGMILDVQKENGIKTNMRELTSSNEESLSRKVLI